MLAPDRPDLVLTLWPTSAARALDEVTRRLEPAAPLRTLVLDLSHLDRVSAATVTALLWTRRRCALHGVELRLATPSRRCRSRLARAGLLQVFEGGTR